MRSNWLYSIQVFTFVLWKYVACWRHVRVVCSKWYQITSKSITYKFILIYIHIIYMHIYFQISNNMLGFFVEDRSQIFDNSLEQNSILRSLKELFSILNPAQNLNLKMAWINSIELLSASHAVFYNSNLFNNRIVL